MATNQQPAPAPTTRRWGCLLVGCLLALGVGCFALWVTSYSGPPIIGRAGPDVESRLAQVNAEHQLATSTAIAVREAGLSARETALATTPSPSPSPTSTPSPTPSGSRLIAIDQNPVDLLNRVAVVVSIGGGYVQLQIRDNGEMVTVEGRLQAWNKGKNTFRYITENDIGLSGPIMFTNGKVVLEPN